MRQFFLELVCALSVFFAGMYVHGHFGVAFTYACSDKTSVFLMRQHQFEEDAE